MSPGVSSRPVTSPVDDDDANDTIDGQLLSHLVGEVTEVDLDEAQLRSFDDLYATDRKSKFAKNKKNQSSIKTRESQNLQ